MTSASWQQADWERAAAIYFPLSIAILAGLSGKRRPRRFVACLLSLLWTVPSLLVLQQLNRLAGWWVFSPGSEAALRGMPLELLIGWAILWGVLPQLALARLSVATSALILLAVDLMLMPLCRASVHLGLHWLLGELVALILVLIPALCIGRWTLNHTHLRGRVVLQIATSGLILLYLVPEIVFAFSPGPGWGPLLTMPSPLRQISLQLIFLLALPGITAALEFQERGFGTPIPYDPPVSLVTTGIYRYCSNPMQASCALVMIAWATLLRNSWMFAAAAVALIYSAGIAEWDERLDLEQRFGVKWQHYRASVKNWLPRWRPYHQGPPDVLYIAESCGPCSEIRAWLERRTPIGLRILDAETLPPGSIKRMRYVSADSNYSVDGVRAMARALEHLNLGWALCGTVLRLPVLWRFVQLSMDAAGLGPRKIEPHPDALLDR